jgi:hypothetical protein
MRITKIPAGLATVAVGVIVVMAFTASASATAITVPTGTTSTPSIHFVNDGGHVEFESSTFSAGCTITSEWKTEQHGAGLTVKGSVKSLAFSGCTGAETLQIDSAGTFEIHWTSAYNGTLTWSGLTTTTTNHMIFGDIVCRYVLKNLIGTITGGNPATVHLEGILSLHGGVYGGFCGQEMKIHGNLYSTTNLYVAP